ncbi:MAG: hypothetical protein E6J94_09295, partial [Methanobacteriota archaeon]
MFFIHARGRLQFLPFLIGFSGRSRRSIGVVLIAALLCIGAVAVAGLLRFGDPSSPVGGGTLHPEASNNFDQVVVVLMENKNQADVYGPATYMTQL